MNQIEQTNARGIYPILENSATDESAKTFSRIQPGVFNIIFDYIPLQSRFKLVCKQWNQRISNAPMGKPIILLNEKIELKTIVSMLEKNLKRKITFIYIPDSKITIKQILLELDAKGKTLPGLKELSISFFNTAPKNDLTHHDIKMIARVFPNLMEMAFPFPPSLEASNEIKKHFKNLETISFTGNTFDDKEENAIRALLFEDVTERENPKQIGMLRLKTIILVDLIDPHKFISKKEAIIKKASSLSNITDENQVMSLSTPFLENLSHSNKDLSSIKEIYLSTLLAETNIKWPSFPNLKKLSLSTNILTAVTENPKLLKKLPQMIESLNHDPTDKEISAAQLSILLSYFTNLKVFDTMSGFEEPPAKTLEIIEKRDISLTRDDALYSWSPFNHKIKFLMLTEELLKRMSLDYIALKACVLQNIQIAPEIIKRDDIKEIIKKLIQRFPAIISILLAAKPVFKLKKLEEYHLSALPLIAIEKNTEDD